MSTKKKCGARCYIQGRYGMRDLRPVFRDNSEKARLDWGALIAQGHRDRVKTVQKCRLRCIWKSKRGFPFITPKQNATHTPPGADSPRENLDDLFTSDVGIV